jgi:ribonucleoside-diphosphate reductase alpha chain
MALIRERLPVDRASYTRVFRLARTRSNGETVIVKFYFTAGLYEDGRVGELFIKADQQGTLASGALDAVAILISMLLQHGVPLADILPKLRHMRFPPDGFTKDPEIPSCSSPLDLLAAWLAKKFLPDPDDVKTTQESGQ